MSDYRSLIGGWLPVARIPPQPRKRRSGQTGKPSVCPFADRYRLLLWPDLRCRAEVAAWNGGGSLYSRRSLLLSLFWLATCTDGFMPCSPSPSVPSLLGPCGLQKNASKYVFIIGTTYDAAPYQCSAHLVLLIGAESLVSGRRVKSRRSRSRSDAVGALEAAGVSGTIGGEEDATRHVVVLYGLRG